MRIKHLGKRKLNNALSLVWKVFCEYEAIEYRESGKQAFWDAIHSQEYLDVLDAYGAVEGGELIGIIATRNEGKHIALFFVDGAFHKKGIGRRLWNEVLKYNESETITVHSSIYAVPVYEKLGFMQTDCMQEEGGIQYIPMEYRMMIDKECPCSKIKCSRYGHCNECRAYHSDSERLRPCER